MKMQVRQEIIQSNEKSRIRKRKKLKNIAKATGIIVS